jgi:PAS domain S-box-containing protein
MSLLPLILAFVFIFAAAFFSAAAAGQESLSIKVGAYANHPKIYMDANGRVSGFWPDLMEHIAEAENWKIEYIWGTWSEKLNRLESKEIDIMPDVAFTEKRSKLYTFSEDSVLMSWARVYVSKMNAEIQSIADLKNKKIAALKGSTNLDGPDGLREITRLFNINCTFLELGDYTEVFKAVEENRADAGITNRNFGNKNANEFNLKKTSIIFNPINIKFAFPKDAGSTPYLAGRINYHIRQLKQDENSIYYRLLGKYFEAEIAEKTVEVFPVLLSPILKSIAGLFIVFMLVIIVSRIQVKRKTKELLAERATLQASEGSYGSVFENTGTATVILEEDGTISMANTEFEKLSGYFREELEGRRKWTEFVVEEDLEMMKVYHAKRREEGEGEVPTEYTFRFIDRHGNIRYVFLRVGMIPGTKRSVTSLMNITALKETEETLRQSEERYRLITDNMTDAVFVLDMDMRMTFASPSVMRTRGYTLEELMDMPVETHFTPESLEVVLEVISREMSPERLARKDLTISWRGDLEIYNKDGSTFWSDSIFTVLRDENGTPFAILSVNRDVSDRKHAEEEIKRSLREKETLLAEVHHRVKNNMQIISSLLSLQSKDIEDERALSLIKNCEDRIKAMSLVHEKLYLSEDLSSIDFHDYMEDLSARLFQVHRVDSRVLSFSSQIKDVSFNIETAIPLGLIINELISNALKHAFPEGKKGSIAVELTQDKKREEYILTVTDDGIGFPEVTDYRNTETFGLQLVDMLTEQFHGTMELDRTKGTSFRITFREQKYRKRI